MHEEFNAVLLREMKAGKRFVVVIDEAQNLDDSVLETVRLLSNFETPRAKLMQIILSGQPELADKLARPNLSQLRQRISILARLAPLSPQHIHEYMQHRLRLSGYSGPLLFSSDAESAIIERSEGIPRTINNLCFNALSLAYALGKRQIDRSLIEEISGDLNLDGIMSHPRAPQFSIPFNSPIFAHTNQWSFKAQEPVVAPSPREETMVPEVSAAAAASANDTELKHLIEELGTKIETKPAVPVNGNGAKPATAVTAQSAPFAPEVKALFAPPAKTTEPKRPPAQSRPAVFTTTPAPRSPYVVKKAAPKNSGPKVRRMTKPIIFGVLAIDFALGAIFIIHQRSGASTDERPAAASVMSMPESSADDGTLVTEEAERSQSGVPIRVSVPASTMRNNIVRMVPPTPPAGVATSESETVLLNATIGRDGRVRSARVIDGDRQLAKAARDAVLQWRYKPYLVNGQPADVETQITVNFNSAANRPAR